MIHFQDHSPRFRTRLFSLIHCWDFNPYLITKLFYSNIFVFSKIQSSEQNTCLFIFALFQFLKMAKRGNCRHRILSGPWILFRVRDPYPSNPNFRVRGPSFVSKSVQFNYSGFGVLLIIMYILLLLCVYLYFICILHFIFIICVYYILLGV